MIEFNPKIESQRWLEHYLLPLENAHGGSCHGVQSPRCRRVGEEESREKHLRTAAFLISLECVSGADGCTCGEQVLCKKCFFQVQCQRLLPFLKIRVP